MGTGSFPGVKCGRGVLLTTHLLHGRVELHLHPTSGPHRACNGITLPFYYTLHHVSAVQISQRQVGAGYTKEYTGREASPYSGTNYKNFIPKNSVMGLQLMLNTFCKTKYYLRETAVAQWLRCCATNRKVAGAISDGVIGIFHWHNPSDHTMVLGSTQPLTEMSTRSISRG